MPWLKESGTETPTWTDAQGDSASCVGWDGKGQHMRHSSGQFCKAIGHIQGAEFFQVQCTSASGWWSMLITGSLGQCSPGEVFADFCGINIAVGAGKLQMGGKSLHVELGRDGAMGSLELV